VPSLLLLVERALSAAGRAQDEAAKLEADLEERHARELAALEARGDETDECEPASVLAASLSACRVGADDGKAVRPAAQCALRSAALRCCLSAGRTRAGGQADARAEAARRPRGGGGRAGGADRRGAGQLGRERQGGRSARAAGPAGPAQPGCARHPGARPAAACPAGAPGPQPPDQQARGQADGNCLYRAVEDQLRQCGADDEAPGSHAELRARVAAHMRAHAAEYAPFIVPVRHPRRPRLPRRAAPCAERPDGRRSRQETDDGEEAASADEVFEEYCRTVEETAAWGGQVELGALAKLLDRSITVYSVGMPAVRMGPDEPGAAPAVWLGASCACCARPHQAPCARQAQAIRACCVCATYAMRLDWASTTTVLSPRAIPSARHAAADVTACCLLPVLALPAGQWTFVRLYAGQLHLKRPSSGPHEPRKYVLTGTATDMRHVCLIAMLLRQVC